MANYVNWCKRSAISLSEKFGKVTAGTNCCTKMVITFDRMDRFWKFKTFWVRTDLSHCTDIKFIQLKNTWPLYSWHLQVWTQGCTKRYITLFHSVSRYAKTGGSFRLRLTFFFQKKSFLIIKNYFWSWLTTAP